MTSNDVFVYKLYLREDELRNICGRYGVYGYQADDIIQDVYAKLLVFPFINRYEDRYGEPNISVVWTIIFRLIIDTKKKESRYSTEELFDFSEIEDIDNEKEYLWNIILHEVDNTKRWFDKEILKLYIEDGHTIRSLAKDTKISRSVIQPIVGEFKKKLKVKVKKGL